MASLRSKTYIFINSSAPRWPCKWNHWSLQNLCRCIVKSVSFTFGSGMGLCGSGSFLLKPETRERIMFHLGFVRLWFFGLLEGARPPPPESTTCLCSLRSSCSPTTPIFTCIFTCTSRVWEYEAVQTYLSNSQVTFDTFDTAIGRELVVFRRVLLATIWANHRPFVTKV